MRSVLRPVRQKRQVHRLFACVLLAATSWSATAPAADWLTFRNDNRRSGTTRETLRLPLTAAWTYTAPAPPETAWSGPKRRVIEGHALRNRVDYDDAFQVAAAGDRLFFGSSVDHHLHCVSAADGSELWRFATGGPVRLAPTLHKGKVLFGSDDGFAYCLNADDGKLVWKLRGGPAEEWLLARGSMISRWPIRTGVMVQGGVAYFGAGIFPHEDVFVYAVKPDDGSIVWIRDDISQAGAGRDDLSPQGSLLAEGDLVFVPSGRSLPAAFHRLTGAMVHKRVHGWRGDAGGVVGGSKAVLADGQLYAGGDHHYVAMDQTNGSVGEGYIEGRRMALDGVTTFTANGKLVTRMDRSLYLEASLLRHKLRREIYNIARALRNPGEKELELRERAKAARQEMADLNEAGIVWQAECTAESEIIATRNLVIAGGQGEVTVFNISSGKVEFQAEIDGDARGLAVANGRLFVSTTHGKIYTFAAAGVERPEEVAQLPEAGKFSPNPKLAGAYKQRAAAILKASGVTSGFCLVVGSELGDLAYELVQASDLDIYCIEPDEAKVASSRKRLAAADLYGTRIVVHHADPGDIAYSNYFANLIVSDDYLITRNLPAAAKRIARHLKPCGGIVCLGTPFGEANAGAVEDWLRSMELADQSEMVRRDDLPLLVRDKLPGAGDWSHQYADASNTATTSEKRVQGGLGVLWYGDPGPGEMVNRHEGAVGPLAVNGRLIVQGEDTIMAYDAYNGQFLWKRENPGVIRTGVFQNHSPGNLAATDDRLFAMNKDKVFELDAATGEQKAVHELPEGNRSGDHEWGYLAVHKGLLVGTASIRKELEAKLRRRGRKTDDATDAIFAIDLKTGKPLWTYQGKSISHRTIAVDDERVFFIDSTITSEQRDELLREDKTKLAKLKGEEAKKAEERLKRFDARLAVAIDAQTGEKLWEKPVDVTDCSEIGIGGGKLTMMVHENVVMLGGANANGHYWRQFLAGDFSERRLVALDGSSGQKLWAKDANYRHRPIVLGKQVIAEPWSFDLFTGKQKMRKHPLTGKDVPWSIVRPGHHCGMLTGCDNMLMFRSGYTGFYDLNADAGTRHFAGHRLGCWINAVPANGLVMIPEASAGCVCLFSIASTITLEPREPRRPWAIYSAVGDSKPVKHMNLNLAAPGDRRDARGKIWLAYPRPNPYKTTGLDLPLDLKHEVAAGGKFRHVNEQAIEIKGGTEWLYTSAAVGLRRLVLPLVAEGGESAKYDVVLHFAEIDDTAPAGRVFSVRMQGQTVLENLDVASKVGVRQTLVEKVSDIDVSGDLVIELVPSGNASAAAGPILNAIEVHRQGK